MIKKKIIIVGNFETLEDVHEMKLIACIVYCGMYIRDMDKRDKNDTKGQIKR